MTPAPLAIDVETVSAEQERRADLVHAALAPVAGDDWVLMTRGVWDKAGEVGQRFQLVAPCSVCGAGLAAGLLVFPAIWSDAKINVPVYVADHLTRQIRRGCPGGKHASR